MLSALAKYIFGGIMSDAPETTSMQYETREINDWLLVDMPDQDIDNEDMDSESDDDDDILTAVPLLLAEEASVSPRQLVLSYADPACDKSCAKIRKGYQDKIHSVPSKVQVHSADKIQGNFVNNTEVISLETGIITNNKVQHNLSEVQENIKSKKSKSKNSKPKKSKKTKVNKKSNAKLQDTPVSTEKECNDDLQVKLEDNIVQDLNEETQYSSKSISENKIDSKLVDKIEEDMHIATLGNSNQQNKDTYDMFPKICRNEIEENANDQEPKVINKEIQHNSTPIQQNLNNTCKRSYADVVKARSNDFDKNYNEEVVVDEVCNNNVESPDISFHCETQNIQFELKDDCKKPKCKKNKPKKMSKNKVQKVEVTSQNISAFIEENSNPKKISERMNLEDNTMLIPSQIPENSDKNQNNFDQKDVSITDISTILENYTDMVEKDFDMITNSTIPEVQQNCETEKIANVDEIVFINVSEHFQNSVQDISNAQDIEIFVDNSKYNCDFRNSVMEENVADQIHSISSLNSNHEYQIDIIDKHQININEINDHYENKIENSFEVQQDFDDELLENIADLWDIYSKIQDSSDDEIHEISDDEMNENFHEDIQDVSFIRMNENFDDQITDDEMNDNSENEYEEISDDEVRKISKSRILQPLHVGRNTYSTLYECRLDEESEDSDTEMFTDRQDSFILSSLKGSMAESNPELLQQFQCNFLEDLKQDATEISKNHSAFVPLPEYELVQYFNFEPQHFYACQSLQYPSSYALAIAEYYSAHDQNFPKYSERCNTLMQKYKRRIIIENQTPSAPTEPSIITNSAELLQKIINEKSSVLPTKTAVVLEHVKELKPIQAAIQFEARKYLTRSQLNRQNRNYIYQSSSKTNRRRNLQRNHSGVNNNRKCC